MRDFRILSEWDNLRQSM